MGEGRVALVTAPAICAEGAWVPVPNENNSPGVGAAFAHNDGGFLTVVCDTTTHLIAIVIKEPRANWKVGEQINVITKDDTGVGNGTSHGVVRTPTVCGCKKRVNIRPRDDGSRQKVFQRQRGRLRAYLSRDEFPRGDRPGIARVWGPLVGGDAERASSAHAQIMPPSKSDVLDVARARGHDGL
jgi:hypothetical protein